MKNKFSVGGWIFVSILILPVLFGIKIDIKDAPEAQASRFPIQKEENKPPSPNLNKQKKSRVFLIAGHGGLDPGACFNFHCEREQVREIVYQTATTLHKHGVDVIVAPAEIVENKNAAKGRTSKINWLKNQNPSELDIIIEIHRDSAPNLSFEDASQRCGVFYNQLFKEALQVASSIQTQLIEQGCNQKTWKRAGSNIQIIKNSPSPDQTFLVELGFMQGNNSSEHITEMARRLAEIVKKQIK